MMSSVQTSVRLRPIRSPKWPKMIAPTGRAKKATANVAKDASTAVLGFAAGKKIVGKTNAAAVPKMKKS